MNEYTPLPYVFDLIYDIKSLESLHDHLNGNTRLATSATDRELLKLMEENDIPLPEGYITEELKELSLEECRAKYAELLEVVKNIHLHAKRYNSEDRSSMDNSWVLNETGRVLANQPGLSEEENKSFKNPNPFLNS